MFFAKLLSGTALVTLLMAAAGSAQVTPEQVWTNWKSMLAAAGYSITTGTESRQGDTLVLTDTSMSIAMEGVSATAPFGTMRMRDRGDGTVEVSYSSDMRLAMTVQEPGAEKVDMVIDLRQPGMLIVASGSPDAMRYDINAPQIGMRLSQLVVDGVTMPLDFDMTMAGVTSTVASSGAGARDQTATMGAASLALKMGARNPDGDGVFTMNATMADLAATFAGTIVPNMSGNDLMRALRDGFRIDAGYRVGATAMDFNLSERGQTTAMKGTLGSAFFDLGMSLAGMRYGTGGTALDATVSGSEIPFPEVNVKLGEYGIGLSMPLQRGEAPEDFSALLRLVDVSITDAVWGMFDPMGALPRDPATVIVDAKGKVKMLVDILDPAQANAAQPGELHALDLTELRVKAVGADLTGSGAFTFDNSDLVTFDGMPRPIGAVDLMLVGGNALLDKLVAMGMIPDDQAMGARMMMGLFGRPVAGKDDTLTSKIEFPPQGGILANGQRIQ
jgi:hypothetical protein